MRRAGRIVALAPAVVEISSGACARCARGRGCGAAALFSPAADAGVPIRLRCEEATEAAPAADAVVGPTAAPTLSLGDRVEVEIDDRDGRWLRAALLVYALPTAGLLLGASLPEPWTPAAALAGLLGGVLAWYRPGAARALDALAGPCPTSARIVSVDPEESR